MAILNCMNKFLRLSIATTSPMKSSMTCQKPLWHRRCYNLAEEAPNLWSMEASSWLQNDNRKEALRKTVSLPASHEGCRREPFRCLPRCTFHSGWDRPEFQQLTKGTSSNEIQVLHNWHTTSHKPHLLSRFRYQELILPKILTVTNYLVHGSNVGLL